jgi:hypothetical protein
MPSAAGNWSKRALWTVGALAVFAALAYGGARAVMWYGEAQVRSPRADKTLPMDAAAKRRFVASAEAIDVTTGELEAAYEANEIAANKRYQGEIVRIEGVVERVADENVGDGKQPFLYFRSHRRFGNGVICMFDDDPGVRESLTTLRKGRRAVVRGMGAGMIAAAGAFVAGSCVVDGSE